MSERDVNDFIDGLMTGIPNKETVKERLVAAFMAEYEKGKKE
jgi:hypothetical protein